MPIVQIKYKEGVVSEDVLEQLTLNLQGIIAAELSISGAVLSQDDVTLEFSEANKRDIGPDLRILTLAHDYPERVENSTEHAHQIRRKVKKLIGEEEITIATPIILVKFGVSGG